jgi:pseudouridylate synthase
MGVESRSVLKKEIRKGLVSLNGEVVKDPSIDVDPLHCEIHYKGEAVQYEAFSYYMMNKPTGVLSSTEDRKQKTVLDLFSENHRKDLFPVGRLDKDSEGLLLIMNDGTLAHKLLSPKMHIEKKYLVEIPGKISEEELDRFRQGIQYDTNLVAMPAKARCLSSSEEGSQVEVIIMEGKFHQIKKMFLALSPDYVVSKLQRLSMGPLHLDPTLAPGEYRKLREEEIQALKDCF